MNTDEKIFKAALRGSITAFETLIQQHERLLYTIAYHMLANPLDAEDLTQEACLKIYKNLSRCKNAANFRSWACAIVNNACIDELRKRKNKGSVSLDAMSEAGEGWELQLSDDSSTPEDELIKSETVREVRQAIAALPEMYRTIVILRDLEDFSYAELAEALNITPALVKSRLSRGRSLLKNIFMEQNKKRNVLKVEG